MQLTVQELFLKDVIDISDGAKVGVITDVAIDSESGRVLSVIIGTQNGLSFKTPPMYVAAWEDIRVIGKQTVLVQKTEKKEETANKAKNILKIFSR